MNDFKSWSIKHLADIKFKFYMYVNVCRSYCFVSVDDLKRKHPRAPGTMGKSASGMAYYMLPVQYWDGVSAFLKWQVELLKTLSLSRFHGNVTPLPSLGLTNRRVFWANVCNVGSVLSEHSVTVSCLPLEAASWRDAMKYALSRPGRGCAKISLSVSRKCTPGVWRCQQTSSLQQG